MREIGIRSRSPPNTQVELTRQVHRMHAHEPGTDLLFLLLVANNDAAIMPIFIMGTYFNCKFLKWLEVTSILVCT